MNVTVYLFGKFGGGYMQYPDNYTQDIFSKFENNIKSPAQLMIHRNDALIYYGYLRKLSEQGKYIGICFVFNGIMCTDNIALCKLGEDTITNWVISGDILEFADNGDIISKVDKLYKTASEFKRLSENLAWQIGNSKLPFKKLPSVNYAVSSDAVKVFSVEDPNETFNDALKDYSNIYIYCDSASEALASYSAKLRHLNKENIRLTEENAKIRRQKKRTTIVIILIIFLALGLFIILLLTGNSTIKSLQIKSLEKEKNTLTYQVNGLQSDTARLHEQLSIAYVNLNEEKSHVTRLNLDSTRLTREISTLRSELATADQNIAAYKQTINQKDRDIRERENTIANLQTQLRNAQANSDATLPFSITAIEVAGVSKNGKDYTSSFGYTISSKSTFHIKVRIKYVSNVNVTKFLTIKLYGPATHGNNLAWYQSEVEEVRLYSSTSYKYFNFTKLLYQKGGRIPSGQYKVEVLYDGKVMQTHLFAVSK